MTGVTFSDYLKGKKNIGKDSFEPIMQDWEDHLSTLFPQIRLKQYLEVRSMDACSWNEICASAAFWAGIIYDSTSLLSALDLMKNWTNEDRLSLNLNVPKYGLNTKFQNQKILDVAKELLKISESGLKRRNKLSTNKKYDETYYLIGIKDNIFKGLSPADLLLKKYYGEWNESIDNIYKELIF